MRKILKIQIEGGFHCCNSIEIRVPILQDSIGFLSNGQQKKLEKYFCGIKDCKCRSYRRAKFTVPDGWQVCYNKEFFIKEREWVKKERQHEKNKRSRLVLENS